MGSPSRRKQKTQKEIDASLGNVDFDLEGVISNLKAEIKQYEGEYNSMLTILRAKHSAPSSYVDSNQINTEELRRLLQIKQYKEDQLLRLHRVLQKVQKTKNR